jgi:hypothetical protein|nr:MAG TPA: hypothetical protein [Caudoviricetes sp.]
MNKDLGPVSAYAVAVANGFVGSVKEWLASLKGEKGKDGERGPAGADGKTPQLKIGTVTTGSTASASITGTAEEPQLNLVLPEGTGGSAGVGQSTEGGGEIFNDYKNNAATGGDSHAEGCRCEASGAGSHAEGYKCKATGDYSHAEGEDTEARGIQSHAEGWGTIASMPYQHVEGVFNKTGEYIHIVGFGRSSEYPANIETLDYAGNLWIAGDITNGQGETLHAAMQAIAALQAEVKTLKGTS